jgi:SynChlorMet cassette protein ScmC
MIGREWTIATYNYSGEALQEKLAGFPLANGLGMGIVPAGELACSIYSTLFDTMQLEARSDNPLLVFLMSDNNGTKSVDPTRDLANDFALKVCKNNCWEIAISRDGSQVVCNLLTNFARYSLSDQLYIFSMAADILLQPRGGMLMHSALACKDGKGVLLIGNSGAGKTTASNRFPKSWKSLSDDSALVVQDATGTFLAQPWPTWSRFGEGGEGGTWKIRNAVPLKAIFFLHKSDEDKVEPANSSDSLAPLFCSARNAMRPAFRKTQSEVRQTLNSQLFSNICCLGRSVPLFNLHASLNGKFWQEIESVLEDS